MEKSSLTILSCLIAGRQLRRALTLNSQCCLVAAIVRLSFPRDASQNGGGGHFLLLPSGKHKHLQEFVPFLEPIRV
jgi:hypothetical protein